MPVEGMEKAEINRLIANAISCGEKTRAELIDHAARMPAERLAGLPASSIALLGSGGLAKVMARKAEIEGSLAPASPVVPNNPVKVARRKHPLRTALLGAAVLLAIGVTIERLAPRLGRLVDPGVRSTWAASWPACARLDDHADGCVYRVGGYGNLTLANAAEMLAMPIDKFAASNSHLSATRTTVLPAGSLLVVWRGILKLKS